MLLRTSEKASNIPGAIYHVINHGDRKEDIFKDDTDRERFLSTLGEACRKSEWQVRHQHVVSGGKKAKTEWSDLNHKSFLNSGRILFCHVW